MAVVDVLNIAGEKVSEVDLPNDIFDVDVKKSVLHDVVKMQLANRRAGTASVKNRSDVKGSTRKLFRQKGTGRARRGDIKAPLLRGGGVVFGPKPKDWGYLLPKKVRALALKMALSSKFQSKNLTILDKVELEQPKTKVFAGILDKIDARNTLIVINEKNENLVLSARNLPSVKVVPTEGLNVYDVLKYEKLVLLESSVSGIGGRFQK